MTKIPCKLNCLPARADTAVAFLPARRRDLAALGRTRGLPRDISWIDFSPLLRYDRGISWERGESFGIHF